MALCKDPSVTFLNNDGYNVVKLPRAGIEPLDVLGKDSSTELLGPLSSVWKSSVAVPSPGAPQPVTSIEGKKTSKLDLSIGLKVLANVLSAFGATTPSLSAQFQKAKTVQFSYSNVVSVSIAPLVAGNFLASGNLNTDNPAVEHYFADDDAQAFLIFDVLKSNQISVVAQDQSGVDLKVDVPAIQGLVGANVGVTTASSSDQTLKFTGPGQVTFGFKALEIAFENGKWKLKGAKASADLAFAVGVGGAASESSVDDDEPILLRTGGLLNLKKT